MKKSSLLTIIITSLAVAVWAQKINALRVPEKVKTSFTKEYPGVAGKWEKEAGKYEVNFKKNGHTMSMTIEPNGSIVETETDILISELPAPAATYIKGHYPGKQIKEASRIINADRSVNYEARVNGKDLIFDTNGKFIKEAKD